RLETGRTHQIRVHLKHISCPVFGDFLYGEEREDVLPGRFALHSAYIRFTHPITGEIMEFSSPLPEALNALMNK
ncbi:MAG: RluA family pseudouridine synthase, partial [Clostridia bacterium]|nr:RluA family pseudouridine synthase [Clostridia bacterium]